MIYQGLELDPFQTDAIRAIDNGESLIVAAPTGCGKTLVAEYAVDVSMEKNMRVVYTAPIKALSNQKFRDFRARFGNDAVGIHTGDVTINPQAPILIMTTEIFRNIILEESERLSNVYYAVFDEIHYLDDPDRGTVWEESIILAPKSIRFMCLSATIPNLTELAGWMSTVRETEFAVIEERHRPVPLKHYLYSPQYGLTTPKGIRKKYIKNEAVRKRFLQKRPGSKKIVRFVMQQGNFPILYFCFNRRACERNADRHSRLNLLTPEESDRLARMVDELIGTYNLEGYVRLERMWRLWKAGVAYHHAGILPAAKEIIERLFTTGLIKLLFCTETFALGVNMPASSVIFDELERFNGVDFSYLATRQYQQMAGRAGRRGMDLVGHVYSQVIPEGTDATEVERILSGKSEEIRSRFVASYSTIMTLYSRLGEEAYETFRKSLSNYRKGDFQLSRGYQVQEEQIRNRIRFLQSNHFLNGTELTKKGQLASVVNGYEIQAAELYFSRSFDECTPEQLPVLLAGLVTEERSSKRRPVSNLNFKFGAQKVLKRLRRSELKHNVMNPIRELDLSLAAPVWAWASGCSLKDLESFGMPEGDLVRLLRMTIQLLRTLRDAIDDPVTEEKMHQALLLVNRDVVDAQAELEAGA